MAGPMVGHVGHDAARIWVQLDRTAKLEIEVRPAGSTTWRRIVRPSGRSLHRRFWPDTRWTGTLDVAPLEPDTTYEYRLISDEEPLPIAGEQTFHTAPLPGRPYSFRLAFGSCAARWGPHPDQPIWDALVAADPEVFLFLGDNVYFDRDRQEWAKEELMWDRYSADRAQPNLQPLLRKTATYAIWDDHDYGPDNSDKTYRLRQVSLGLFTSFWANPFYGTDGVPGVWTTFQRGRVQVFLLDGRYHRDPDNAPDGPHKTQWGSAQRAWLAEALRDSRATFKLIATGGQFLVTYHDDESHDLYRYERQWLIDLIREHGIEGVVFLSGDRHLGEVLRWTPPRAPYPLYEFTSSPLAAGVAYAPPPDEEVGERVPGSVVREENFGVIDFDFHQPDDPRLRFQLYGVDGRPRGVGVELKASTLRASGN